MVTLKEAVMNYPEEYVSVSTRLPKIDAISLTIFCKKHGITTSEYIRDLIRANNNSPNKAFLSGKNKISYNKTNNSFDWNVELDSGQELSVLDNLSVDFLKNLNDEIASAIKERNEWVHQTKHDSVEIPNGIIGAEDG